MKTAVVTIVHIWSSNCLSYTNSLNITIAYKMFTLKLASTVDAKNLSNVEKQSHGTY